MDEEDTKLCSNCKREIPTVNYTIHSVHCARNIRPCPVCKEPVPASQLEEHHDALHKEVPCKKCGESVCGTDLEDHIRDSCAQTIKPCRYCELELPRRSLPAHETYCGARSEQCAECGEYVMAKYRQLHRDSNHGFIRLDEDPVPPQARPKPKPAPQAKPNPKPVSNGIPNNAASTSNIPRTQIRHYNQITQNQQPSSLMDPRLNATTSQGNISPFAGSSEGSLSDAEVDRLSELLSTVNQPRECKKVDNRVAESSRANGVRPAKRTNDQPQINTNVKPADKVNKQLPLSRGAVKKRPAPPPPDARRDNAFRSAARRQYEEQARRDEQTAYNLSVGLPPVLSPAAKLEKLRKMDALHNPQRDAADYKQCLQGRVWQPMDVPTGHVLGGGDAPSAGRRDAGAEDFSHLQPMSHEQFINRFSRLQAGAGAGAGGERAAGGAGADRFDEIKSSLRALRRGLNEVTAPYNSAPRNTNSPRSVVMQNYELPEEELWLPCEFCGISLPADDLVLHQTGCRPDLARVNPAPASPAPARAPAASEVPVIPCEFCTESLPVYLISDHQERCRREGSILYPD